MMGNLVFGRRTFLLGSMAVGATSVGSGLVYNQSYGLSATAGPRRCATMLGTALSDEDIAASDEDAIVPRLFRGMTCQSAMKSRVIFADPRTYNFGPADAAMAFAERNNLKVRGHTLLWHLAMPRWLEQAVASGAAGNTIRKYIGDVAGRYRGRIMAWDVVNEPLSDSSNRFSSPLKPTVLTSNLGEDIIAQAFRTSHAADPASKKYLNDFFFLLPDNRCRNKIRNCLRFAERALASGVPIKGIGLQGHLNAGTLLPRAERVEFFRNIRDMGLEISVTEMDVRDLKRRASPDQRDQIIADTASDFLDSLGEAGVRCPVFTWGMTDRTHARVLQDKFNVGEQRPAPLDKSLRPKLLMSVLQNHLLA